MMSSNQYAGRKGAVWHTRFAKLSACGGLTKPLAHFFVISGNKSADNGACGLAEKIVYRNFTGKKTLTLTA